MNLFVLFGVLFGFFDFPYSGISTMLYSPNERGNLPMVKLRNTELVINIKLIEVFEKLYNVYLMDKYYKSITVFHNEDLKKQVRLHSVKKRIGKLKKDVRLNLLFLKNLNKYSIDLTSLYIVMQMKVWALSNSLSFGDCATLYTYSTKDLVRAKECHILARYLYWWGNLELPAFVERFQFVLNELSVSPEYIQSVSNLLALSSKIKLYQLPDETKRILELSEQKCSVEVLQIVREECLFNILREDQISKLGFEMKDTKLFLRNIKIGKRLEFPVATIDYFEESLSKMQRRWGCAYRLVEHLHRTHPECTFEKNFDDYCRYYRYESIAAHILYTIEYEQFQVEDSSVIETNRMYAIKQEFVNSFIPVVVNNFIGNNEYDNRIYCTVLKYDEINQPLKCDMFAAKPRSISNILEEKYLFLESENAEQENECVKKIEKPSEEQYFSATDGEDEDEDEDDEEDEEDEEDEDENEDEDK